MNKKLQARFTELEDDIKTIMDTKYTSSENYISGQQKMVEYIDEQLYREWYFKVKNLLILCSGEDSMYSKEFVINNEDIGFSTNLKIFKKLEPIFRAVKDDYENGYITSIRSLITAEVFDNELEQAQELLTSKYHSAAAVIAGVVLETALRELCDKASIAHGKLDKMNADLTKADVYSKLQMKKITSLADIRNSAAHGKTSEFTHDDVNIMIRDIESFLVNHLSD